MTKRIWAGLLALGMALTALPLGIYAEETAWEEEANASEETLDGGLDESAEEFADGLPDYIPEPETDVVDGAADDESADALPEQEESLTEEATPDLPDFIPEEEPPTLEESELPPVQAGDFVWVTANTRVYLDIDETAGNDDDGELYDGNFVNEANVMWNRFGRMRRGERGCWCATCMARKNRTERWRGRIRRWFGCWRRKPGRPTRRIMT